MWRCGAPDSVVASTVPLMPGATALARTTCRVYSRLPGAGALLPGADAGVQQRIDGGIRAVPSRLAAQPERMKSL